MREGEVEVFHGYTRRVRRAFLCGQDPLTGNNYDHRKRWIEQRLEQLSASMAVGSGKADRSPKRKRLPAEMAGANAHRRASNKGLLGMGLDDYLRILDWTGRQGRRNKRDATPKDLASILERIGMSDEFGMRAPGAIARLLRCPLLDARCLLDRQPPGLSLLPVSGLPRRIVMFLGI